MKNCKPCQFVNNLGLALDKFGNALLLGSPNETISRRVARAKSAGHSWAVVACRVLSFIVGRNHCEVAMSPGTTGRELWAWSPWLGEPELNA